jgi:hypothetical protein
MMANGQRFSGPYQKVLVVQERLCRDERMDPCGGKEDQMFHKLAGRENVNKFRAAADPEREAFAR